MKRDKLDDVFSKLVRERVNFTCEACQTYYPEDRRMGLHCSHFYTRSKRSVRWFPDNATAHCYKCHTYYGGHPVEFAEWTEARLGAEKFHLLRRRAHTPLKLSKPDKEDLYQDMKAELERMQSERKSGVTGRIEFMEAA